MSIPHSTGLFARANRERRLCAVAMNDVQFLYFGQNGLSAIGTEGLSGCSVVMITSHSAAILAHIPPRPSTADPHNEHIGDDNVRAVMQRVTGLHEQYRVYFSGADTFVLCAIYGGDIALPDQKKIIEGSIIEMGLAPVSLFYDVPPERSNPGQGTALVDSKDRNGLKPLVYIEDRLVSDNGVAVQQSQTSSSQWIWDSEHQRYRRYVNGEWEWASG